MTLNELLKNQLLTTECNNYYITTSKGELIESYYQCLFGRGKQAFKVYKENNINILSTKIVEDSYGKLLCITIDY